MNETSHILVPHHYTHCSDNKRLQASLKFTSRVAGELITAQHDGTIYYIDMQATATATTERYIVVTPFDVIAVLVVRKGVDVYVCTYDDEAFNDLFPREDGEARSIRGW